MNPLCSRDGELGCLGCAHDAEARVRVCAARGACWFVSPSVPPSLLSDDSQHQSVSVRHESLGRFPFRVSGLLVLGNFGFCVDMAKRDGF